VDQSPSSWIASDFGGAYLFFNAGTGGSVTMLALVVPLTHVAGIGPV
jgi:hypothetical protein